MISIIITTLSSEIAAKEMAKKLLEAGLVACVNTTQCRSQYKWQGDYYDEIEFRMHIKTSLENKEATIKTIKELHPYETPLIASKDFEINNSYKAWMDGLIG